jgi:hypothetical protein
MKRMFLLPGIAVLFTLAILFTGCPQPADTTVNNGSNTPLVKLADPKVRVTAYEGFNVISWEPVPDAANYRVWRTDTQSSSQVTVGSGPVNSTDKLSVVDDVTEGSEKLADGRTYKYIVVAYPNSNRYANTNATPTAQEDLYSGKGEASVKANIPDPATYKVLPVTDIKYRLDSDGTLFVSWTQPANATATIGYFPGGYPVDAAYPLDAFDSFNPYDDGGNSSLGDYLFTDTDAGYLYPRNAVSAKFPVIGGQGTIAIQTKYWKGNFYAKDKPATVDITFDQYDLDLQWSSAGKVTASYIHETATTGKVQLSWPRILGDEDTYSDVDYSTSGAEKVTYNVWKRKIALDDDSLGQVTSDWEKVDYTITLTPIEPGDGHSLNTIYAVEGKAGNLIAASVGTWQYVVFASATNGAKTKTSHSRPLVGLLSRTLPSEALIDSVAIAYGAATPSDGQSSYTIRIAVKDLADGVSYKLYRGEYIPVLTNDTGAWLAPGTYQFTAYDPKPVQEWTGRLVTGDTTTAIYDTGIAIRKSYLYKLVSTMGDTLLGDGSVKELKASNTKDATSVYSSLNLNVAALTLDYATVTKKEDTNDTLRGWIEAKVDTMGGYSKDIEVRLFWRRARTAIPGVTEYPASWTELATFDRNTQPVGGAVSQITDENGVFKTLKIAVPNPVYGEDYQFKAVAYRDGAAMPNLNQADYSGAHITLESEAIKESALSTSEITGTFTTTAFNLANDTTQTITGIQGNFLNGATINVRIARNTVDPDEQTYYVQPGEFTFARVAAATFAANARYEIPISLTVRPTGGTAAAPNYDNYTVQWKYSWEKWEEDKGTLNDRTDDHAWWVTNRAIQTIYNY